jgi:predicted nucleic acid-binding protein
VTLLVDTSVWSLAFRRDAVGRSPEVDALHSALEHGDSLVTTGLVLQELLQGFAGPRDRSRIIDRFGAIPLVSPDRQDHIDAAALRNACRRAGVQVGTIDAILAQLCIRHDLTMLTTDKDFTGIAGHSSLRVWTPARQLPAPAEMASGSRRKKSPPPATCA